MEPRRCGSILWQGEPLNDYSSLLFRRGAGFGYLVNGTGHRAIRFDSYNTLRCVRTKTDFSRLLSYEVRCTSKVCSDCPVGSGEK